MGLEDIIKENHYPIVFIGSGISKRYLKNSPTWTDLLNEYWGRLNQPQNFYAYLRSLNDKYQKNEVSQTDFLTNTEAATKIEEIFNDAFFSGTINLPNLTLKEAQQKHLSPFKYDLANRFISTELRDNIPVEEFDLFKTFLQKSRMIVTTNYDSLVEDTISKSSTQKPKIYIGNSGFFDEYSDGWSEIYKIHGSSSSPESIIINKDDYDEYDQNSILISAKILSSMIESPILFLGYSITDRDIKKLLSDFSKQLPVEDTRKSANRIFVIEYQKGLQQLDEKIVHDNNLDFNYTSIKTDNYAELYSKISQIDEGVTPYEVRRFQHVIKKIIITSGQKKSLDSYLVRPSDLDSLENKIDDGKPIVVALGDTKNIFVNPTPTSYISDYILQKFEIMPEVALRFIAREQNNGRYPLLYHYKNIDLSKTQLEPFEKNNITSRIAKDESSFIEIKKTINKNNHKVFSDLSEILELNDVKLAKRIDLITYNADLFNLNELTNFVQNKALPTFIDLYKKRNAKNGAEKSAYRKLFVAWDILVYSDK